MARASRLGVLASLAAGLIAAKALAQPASSDAPSVPAPSPSAPSPVSTAPAPSPPASAAVRPESPSASEHPESSRSGADAHLLPTFTPTGEFPSRMWLRAPTPADGELGQRARELDLQLEDAAQDLGLSVRIANRGEVMPAEATEGRLSERAVRDHQWQISPRLEEYGSKLILRIVVVPPGSRTAFVRVEQVDPENLLVRAGVMLRDLVRAAQGQPPRATPLQPSEGSAWVGVEPRVRSEGRATLAVNAALLGGFVGYALQKSSGSDDVRITYPLLALGAGIGVGGSLIAAEEWDVRLSDAWFLSGAAVSPALGGLMIARGREVEPASDRWAWGIAGGLGGIVLGATALSFGHVSDAGGAFPYSGGLIGAGYGGAIDMLIRGTTDTTPYEGMGYGAIAGALAGGLIGMRVRGPGSRVFMVDVGVALGGLSAAAASSPLLFGDRTEGRDRAFLGVTMAGGIAGGAIAYMWTASRPKKGAALLQYGLPTAGVIGESRGSDGRAVPAYGIGWNGRF